MTTNKMRVDSSIRNFLRKYTTRVICPDGEENKIINIYKIYNANLCISTIRGRDCVRNNPKEFSDSCSPTTGVCPWHQPSWTSGGRRRSSTSSAATATAHPPRITCVLVSKHVCMYLCMWRAPLYYTHTIYIFTHMN